jgi:hypothetical protein
VQLNNQKDVVRWKIGSSSDFKVKGLYLQLRSTGVYHQRFIWKTKNAAEGENFHLAGGQKLHTN